MGDGDELMKLMEFEQVDEIKKMMKYLYQLHNELNGLSEHPLRDIVHILQNMSDELGDIINDFENILDKEEITEPVEPSEESRLE